MAKQMVEVEIPSGWELACPHVRPPQEREYWYSVERNGVYLQCRGALPSISSSPGCDGLLNTDEPRIIVRKAWQWPAWLKAECIAMDMSCLWYAYSSAPKLAENHRYWSGEGVRWIAEVNNALFDFTPPPCDDWRQSLRKNPNL